ncbi:MAG: hypothetical protein MJ158_02045, partial [Alphaproteobacteria bacterium]|nr:hypothetical protein [Alphaproteobacteria bacterium]
ERLKKYINTITNKIHSLITNDKISPNDIMILLKEREPFAPLLSKALKKLNIPVAGNDRINLSKFIAIKDMLNLLRFCLDYKDNYSLCCILKSPFYRLKELDIFNLSTEAKQQKNTCFFETLQTQYPNIYKDLQDTIFASKNMGPFSFFSYLLNKNDNKKNMVKYIGKQVLDPLDEFINICLSYERTQPGTLKHFLKWFITGNNEIKRDMDSSSGIRIMSIHGSKGLASDVVFLIDTTDIPDTNQIINIEQSDSKFWLWTKGCNSAEITMAKTIAKQKNLEEYYRLLYVAMTRAKNRLYIYGCDNHITSDKSWHSLLWNTLAKYKIDDDTIIINNDTVL